MSSRLESLVRECDVDSAWLVGKEGNRLTILAMAGMAGGELHPGSDLRLRALECEGCLTLVKAMDAPAGPPAPIAGCYGRTHIVSIERRPVLPPVYAWLVFPFQAGLRFLVLEQRLGRRKTLIDAPPAFDEEVLGQILDEAFL